MDNSFKHQPIKTVIESSKDFKSHKLSVAFVTSTTGKNKTWSAKFKDYPKYPNQDDINDCIKKGFAMEITGAFDKFGVLDGQFQKSFN